MKKLINWLRWLDNNLLKILVTVFIFLIPLYPKLPIKMVNFTYIAIRLEDFYVAFLTLVFFFQLLRKKVQLNFYFFLLFSLYWFLIFASTLSGIYILKTIEIAHLGYLHALRRIEYMIIFLVILSLIKTKKDFFYYLSLIFITLFIVNLYGIGQKFLGWPAVQTMNPEYAKGYLLFLTPEARVSSTFAGHYDLASYLVFLMPVVLSFYFLNKKLRYFFIFIISLITLIFTASRISYIAYILTIFPFLIFLKKFKYFFIVLFLTIIFTFSSNNLTSRLKRTFQVKQIFVNEKTGQIIVPQKITTKELPAGTFYLNLKDQSISTKIVEKIAEQEKITSNEILLKEKIIEEAKKEARQKGKILTKEEEEEIFATIAAKLKPVSTVVSDISFATRLQVEWPRALKAFRRNLILGSGPSSITEATDNDYLRSLGEVGLLGSLSFGLIFLAIIKKIFNAQKKSKNEEKIIFWGYLFGLLALLINATYIDVFEASKMAYNFWLISGLFIGLTLVYERSKKSVAKN
ncbi:MAG: O-antigen ligase family protein [Microgenomates group bacterium]